MKLNNNRSKIFIACVVMLGLIGLFIFPIWLRFEVRRLADEYMRDRESQLVTRYRDKVNQVRVDMSLPPLEMKSLEDVMAAITGPFAGIDSIPQTTNSVR